MSHPPPMTAPEIAAIVGELAAVLPGARLREVRQRGDADLVLALRLAGTNLFLLVSAHPQCSRLYALTERPPGPWRASPFRDACRHALSGGRVAAIAGHPGDRRASLTVVRGTAPDGPRFTLEAELFGRHANLILVDQRGLIREVLRPVRGQRRLEARAPYAPPPPTAAPPTALPPGLAAEAGAAELPVNRAAARRYELAVAAADLAEAKAGLRKRLDASIARGEKKAARLRAELERAARADSVRRQGELLKANLHGARRGLSEMEVLDHFADPPRPVTIPLDPLRSPTENLEALFKRYRKLRSGRERTRQVLTALAATQAHKAALRERVRRATSTGEVAALESEALEARLLRPPQALPREPCRAPPERRREPLAFRSADGLEILVGRSGEENDRLTFRIGRGHDLWLHVRDHPGSHVLVRLPRGKPCPPETLLDAAHLAVHFSRLRGASRAEVVHTSRKFVSRLKKARPGQVTLSKISTLGLRLEEERLQRLLGRLA